MLQGGNIVIVKFDQFFDELGNDTAFVQVHDGSTWHTVWFHTDDDIGSWNNPVNSTVIITDHVNASGDTKVRFRYVDGASWAWTWNIDNVVIESVDCLEPQNVTVTPGAIVAEVNFMSGSGSSDIIWGDAGFDPATEGTVVEDITSPYTITGLTGETSYDVYLLDDCGGFGLSDTVGPVAFTTTVDCPTPTWNSWNPFQNVGSFQADLIFETQGIGDVYMIIGELGFILGVEGDTVGPITSPYTITGLDAETTYDVQIFMNCTDDGLGYSTNASGGPADVTTLPACPCSNSFYMV